MAGNTPKWKPGDTHYLDQHCALCFGKPVRYAKTKGSFHKVCDKCRQVLAEAGLLTEDARVIPMAQTGRFQHGINCAKVNHARPGMLHDADDDRPYDVDGVMYCGRCHGAL